VSQICLWHSKAIPTSNPESCHFSPSHPTLNLSHEYISPEPLQWPRPLFLLCHLRSVKSQSNHVSPLFQTFWWLTTQDKSEPYNSQKEGYVFWLLTTFLSSRHPLLFLFTWLILAHIFKPNSRILCIWYLCARIKKYFIHSTNSYRGLSTCQALFWDLVEDTTDKRTYLHITLILKRKTNKRILKKHVKYMICQIKVTWRKIKQDEVWGEHWFGE